MPIRRYSDYVDDTLSYLSPVHKTSSRTDRKLIAKATEAMDGDLSRLPPLDKGSAINAIVEQLGLSGQVRPAPSYAADPTAQALASLAALGALVDPANPQNQTTAPAPVATVLAEQARDSTGDVDLSWSAPASAQVTKSSAAVGPDGQPMGPLTAVRKALLQAHAAHTIALAVAKASTAAPVAKSAPVVKAAPVTKAAPVAARSFFLWRRP